MKAPGTAYDDPVLGKDPQPAHMKDYVNTTQDNGGVHINSGIPNNAFYVTAYEIGGYAWEKAGRIWCIPPWADRLSSTAGFQDAANATYQVAADLYGANSMEQMAVQKGWAEVGITVGQVTHNRSQAAFRLCCWDCSALRIALKNAKRAHPIVEVKKDAHHLCTNRWFCWNAPGEHNRQ